ncbi:MAG TPA: hypothetical protein VD704_10930, partial [Gaiellaceae bacterium]|nr:hypothetical protein [Gaiellaceae bacterium]
PALLEELREHYVRAGFAVAVAGERTLAVERADAPDQAQARREIAAHLLIWQVLRPDVEAELLD